jgi:undecaprenyl-diphosphatase
MTRVLDPRRYSPGAVIAASTALLTLTVVLGGLLPGNSANPPFLALDNAWHEFIGALRSPVWDGVNEFLNIAGYRGIYALHACLVIILLARRRPQAAVFSVVAAAAVALLTQLIKVGTGRSRPANTLVLTDTGSFPSGHVSATGAFLLVVALLVGRLWMWLLAVLGTLTMMVSRTYLGAHWLMDTLGGAFLAAAVVPLIWLMFQNACVRENGDARRLLTWRARASRRQRAARQAGSERG